VTGQLVAGVLKDMISDACDGGGVGEVPGARQHHELMCRQMLAVIICIAVVTVRFIL
jgi:hypothetical protein